MCVNKQNIATHGMWVKIVTVRISSSSTSPSFFLFSLLRESIKTGYVKVKQDMDGSFVKIVIVNFNAFK